MQGDTHVVPEGAGDEVTQDEAQKEGQHQSVDAQAAAAQEQQRQHGMEFSLMRHSFTCPVSAPLLISETAPAAFSAAAR